MEPIIRAMQPIAGIEVIEIFPAVHDDWGTMVYPVRIDSLQLTFHLDEQANWVYSGLVIVPDEIRCMVGDLIEKIHQ